MAGIQNNRYYNDPALGQAFSNLSGLFGPPSASDTLAYASAKAKKEEAGRLAELFNLAKDPNVQQAVFDRLGQATGQWTPSTGYYGVDTTAATARRGQDIGAATELQKQRIADEGALARLYATPQTINKDQTLVLPEGTAGAMGLPRMMFGQTGAAQGETIFRPDGTVLKGEAKPLSETEAKAGILSGLPANEQRAAALSGVPVENVVGNNGLPEIIMRSDAVGRQPYFNKGAEAKPTNAVALMPDGTTRVPARQDLDGRWVHAQTGQALPENIQIFGLPQATGTASDVGLSPTTANTTQANNQEAEVTRALNLLDIYEGVVRDNPGSIGLAGLIRGTAQNAAQTATDLAAAFGKSAPQVQEAANEIKQGLARIAPEFFDASIPEIDFLQGTLAYSLARTENPSGEVSRQAFERAYERVKGGGILANRESALASIGANRKVLQTQLDGIRTLRSPGTGRTDTSFQSTGGQPAGGQTKRMKFDANGNLVQ